MDSVVLSGYPSATNQASCLIKDVPTEAMVVGLADKIIITITQDGRLAQWVHVPLGSDQLLLGGSPEVDEDDSLLPLVHLTPTTLLGGTIPERETAGQLLAVQLSSMISARKKDESRTVVCGLGLRSAEFDQQSYLELIELVGKCL